MFQRFRQSEGFITASVVSIAALLLFITADDRSQRPKTGQPRCQEVVAHVERRGNVLASCPVGTYIEIVNDDVVVCRCLSGREEYEDVPEYVFPQEPIERDRVPHHDDTGIDL